MDDGIKLESSTEQSATASAPAQVSIPYDIRASVDTMTQYLLTKDKIQTIRSAVASDESTMFGIGIGVCGAISGVLLPLYISGNQDKTGMLIPFLWAALAFFAVLSIYFAKKWYWLRRESNKTFNEILEKSKTVLIFPKQD